MHRMVIPEKDMSTSSGNRTLSHPISYTGEGPYTRERILMIMHPAASHTGITIVRRDVAANKGSFQIDLLCRPDNKIGMITNEHGYSIGPVLPLLRALQECRIDNLLIEISGREIPLSFRDIDTLITVIRRSGIQTLSDRGQ